MAITDAVAASSISLIALVQYLCDVCKDAHNRSKRSAEVQKWALRNGVFETSLKAFVLSHSLVIPITDDGLRVVLDGIIDMSEALFEKSQGNPPAKRHIAQRAWQTTEHYELSLRIYAAVHLIIFMVKEKKGDISKANLVTVFWLGASFMSVAHGGHYDLLLQFLVYAWLSS